MADSQMNILLVTADQLRADCVESGSPRIVQTPHIDQLSYEGTQFTSAYADCPICIPSRCSLISGQYASTYGKPYFFRHQPFPIDRQRTLMSCLTRAGYQTQAVGKMHFFPERACYGFENMVLDLDYSDWLREKGYRTGAFTSRGLGLNEFFPVPATTPSHLTSTAWTVDESIRFLDRRDPDRPFFLWTSFHKPHPPIDPPEPYFSMYDPADVSEPSVGDWVDTAPLPQRFHREAHKYDLIDASDVRRIRAAYYGLITEIDHQLGRLFGALAQRGELDNTLIVLTTDHGEMLGDHRDFGKTTLYDASARVPLIVRWPKQFSGVRRGSRCDAPVALVDLLPTLVECAGGDVPGDIDGTSLLGLARGSTQSVRPFVPLHVQWKHGIFGLTDGAEKYLWYRWGGTEQLFDLRADPLECHDLAHVPDRQSRVAWWRDQLVNWLTERSHPAVKDAELQPIEEPYDEREVRASNPLGWAYDRPFS